MERHLSRSCLLKGEQPIFHRNSPPPALNRKSITRGRERPVIRDMTHTHARVCRRIQGKVPSPRSSPCESSSNSENELLSREGARRTRRTVSRAEATPTGRRSRNETERNETTRVLPAPGTVRPPASARKSRNLSPSPILSRYEISSFSIHLPYSVISTNLIKIIGLNVGESFCTRHWKK